MGSRTEKEAEELIPKFKFEKLLNQYQGGLKIALLGKIDPEPALITVERAVFSSDPSYLKTLAKTLTSIENLGNNDVYLWYMATSNSAKDRPKDLKINLIYPCTEKHVKKYSAQSYRIVTETPTIYHEYIRPYMQKQREEGRLNWVFNIIEGRTEQDQVIYREHGDVEGFLLIPDLNWDRETVTTLHLLGIVERRDIWSLRDLRKEHVVWLRHMRQKLLDATTKIYPEIEEDQIKLYVHYQPTYHHFHIHVVHVMREAGKTEAVGKAFGLDNLITQVANMEEGKGMADIDLVYDVGEASDLWTEIFQPLKAKKE